MPKAEVGSIKDIGKRIKAKGLQKLKFYCQMCQKQCRDANGFKCHMTSDSHIRQMKLFSENATGYMDRYSKQFEKLFIDTLRMRHSTTKVNANNVYQEVIRDKNHIHMNSTIWTTLGDFCKYLGKCGKCIVEETERGWYVSYIDRDPAKLAQQHATEQRLANEQVAEYTYQQQMSNQRIEATKQLVQKLGTTIHIEPSHIMDTTNDINTTSKKTVQIRFNNDKVPKSKKVKSTTITTQFNSMFGDDDDGDDDDDENQDDDVDSDNDNNDKKTNQTSTSNIADNHNDCQSNSHVATNSHYTAAANKKRKHSENSSNKSSSNSVSKSTNAMTESVTSNNNIQTSTLGKQDQNQESTTSISPWLYPNIMVRIVTKTLADGLYFKRKAIVDSIHDDGYVADITILKDDDDDNDDSTELIQIRIDQDDLQTVAPKRIGETIRIVRHSDKQHRFQKAIVIALNKKEYNATVQLKKDKSVILRNIDFDDITRIG